MFLGVDGGGTKTALCLVGDDGSMLGLARAPSTDYFATGIDLVERVLREGVAAVCSQAGISTGSISYAFFGLPTYGEASDDLATLDAAPRAALGHDRYACGNDMVCGWAGSLGGADGINVVCGTGSIAYGERAGRHARVGGWGELFGDEGSAYWIATRGLGLFSQMADGRRPRGPLLEVLHTHLQLSSDLDVIDVVLNRWKGRRDEIASLSRPVAHAAEAGDTAAAGVLQEAGAELAGLVETARHRLGFAHHEVVPVSYSGGVFGADLVLQAFRAHLNRTAGTYDLRVPLYPPEVGAAIYAAKLAGTPLDQTSLRRLRQSTADSTEEAS